MVLRIAHRGGSAPENSLEAFRNAVGFDAVEFDIRCTKDGEVVVIHDRDVGRTTDGVGLVSDLTLEELKRFRLSNGESVPTLQEALDVLKGCICKIDVKSEGIDIIDKIRGIEDSVIITSEIYPVLKTVPSGVKIEAGGLKGPVEDMIKKAESINADIMGAHHSVTTRELVERAHEKGFEVHVWTVNDKESIERMKLLGVDGITSDRPDII